jgi:ATP-dependent helicase IRC3
VHRRELVDQAYFAFQKWCKGVRIGRETGEQSSCSLDKIVVASVQSLGKAGTGRLSKFRPHDFGLVICDEAHHSIASTYQNVFDHFGVSDGSNSALLLGVTATPVRSDGKGLDGVFDEIVYQMDIRDAVTSGWLVDIKGVRARTEAKLDEVRVMPSGDFDLSSLISYRELRRNKNFTISTQTNTMGLVPIAY